MLKSDTVQDHLYMLVLIHSSVSAVVRREEYQLNHPTEMEKAYFPKTPLLYFSCRGLYLEKETNKHLKKSTNRTFQMTMLSYGVEWGD